MSGMQKLAVVLALVCELAVPFGSAEAMIYQTRQGGNGRPVALLSQRRTLPVSPVTSNLPAGCTASIWPPRRTACISGKSGPLSRSKRMPSGCSF